MPPLQRPPGDVMPGLQGAAEWEASMLPLPAGEAGSWVETPAGPRRDGRTDLSIVQLSQLASPWRGAPVGSGHQTDGDG
ncbi:MAG: hypothetical protein VKJ63_05080 [Synechococcus sp.]|nr:hypothetical protein [Synechococcus sp.]